MLLYIELRGSCSLFFEYRQTFITENKQYEKFTSMGVNSFLLVSDKATWR